MKKLLAILFCHIKMKIRLKNNHKIKLFMKVKKGESAFCRFPLHWKCLRFQKYLMIN